MIAFTSEPLYGVRGDGMVLPSLSGGDSGSTSMQRGDRKWNLMQEVTAGNDTKHDGTPHFHPRQLAWTTQISEDHASMFTYNRPASPLLRVAASQEKKKRKRSSAGKKCFVWTEIYYNMVLYNIQVVPGRVGGGSFRRKKNYIAKKEFAYRMCARRPTSAMPKPFLCCERAFCCSMVVMWPVLMHVMSFDVVVMSFDAMWLLVLCHVTWCNAMSCDVPCNGHVVCSKWFCDNVVIQSTILYYKVLLCTTKYYSSTTLYYKVLLQYYSVLHSTTTYYSSTTLYYKVLLQYYSVLQSTTPVLLCTTKYYSSTTLYYNVLLQYYPVLQSTTPVLLCTAKYYSSTTLYYKVLLCTTKYYSSTTLYYKVLLQYYSVLHSTTTYYSSTTLYYSSTTLYYKVLLQYYSVVHSATTYYSSITLYYKAAFIWTVIYMIDVRRIWNVMYNARSNRSHPPTSPNTAPATQNDCDDWSASHMKRHLQCAEQQDSQSNFTKYCACHAKWIPWLIRVSHMKRHFDPRHIWNVIYNARSKQSHPLTSPNTAPATKSASSRFQRKLRELLPPIERRFDDNPTMIRG